MKRNHENILLGLLWLTTATLGTTFWFNIRFGFNLFSGAHWDYLATQQATRAPISFCFYASFVVATFITLFVLYLLIRPHKRNIQLAAQAPQSQNVTNTSLPDNSFEAPPTAQETTPAPIMLQRPPRLNITPSSTMAPAPTSATQNAIDGTPTPQTTPITQPVPQQAPQQDWPQIREIFSTAGYIIKPEPRINGEKMALFAIGTDEVLWVGAVGISTSQMQSCVNKLEQLFHDTLEDIEINVNAFVLNPSGATTDSSVLTFDTVDSLRDYMNTHRNAPLDADDAENFAAYSEYITTVIEYIGKL